MTKHLLMPGIPAGHVLNKVIVEPKEIKDGYITGDYKNRLTSVFFSSSASGKYQILKNGIVLATLFSGLDKFKKETYETTDLIFYDYAVKYGAAYPFDVIYDTCDTIEVKFINMDVLPADFYLSYEEI